MNVKTKQASVLNILISVVNKLTSAINTLNTPQYASGILGLCLLFCSTVYSRNMMAYTNVSGIEIEIVSDIAQDPIDSDLVGNPVDDFLSDADTDEEQQISNNEDLWLRIKDGYAMPDVKSTFATNHEKWYSSRPEYLKRMVERGQKYLFHIVEEVEKRGMPSEIALLPMIESAFNPQAFSHSAASGIWQFIDRKSVV